MGSQESPVTQNRLFSIIRFDVVTTILLSDLNNLSALLPTETVRVLNSDMLAFEERREVFCHFIMLLLLLFSSS